MPLNESLGRPSNLTQQQQREAMRAVYGLAEEHMTPSDLTDLTFLTFEQRQQLRRALDRQDQKEVGNKVFDLNKPPQEKYVYREYPMLMYRYTAGDPPKLETKAAHSYDERMGMHMAGWSEDSAVPVPADGPVVELTAEESAEAALMDRELKKKKPAGK